MALCGLTGKEQILRFAQDDKMGTRMTELEKGSDPLESDPFSELYPATAGLKSEIRCLKSDFCPLDEGPHYRDPTRPYHPGASWNPQTQLLSGRWNGCARYASMIA